MAALAPLASALMPATVLGKVALAGAGLAAGKAAHDVAKTTRAAKRAADVQAATGQDAPLMQPDIESIRLARRRSEAARVGSGRASTILTGGGGGTLGPG